MRAERSLGSAVQGMILSAGFAFVSLLVARHFYDQGGLLAFLTMCSAALFISISVSMFAILAAAYCLILLRQPDDVSPDGMEEGTIYREVKRGAVIYQNVTAIPGVGMVTYFPDQPAPTMRLEPSAVRGNGRGLPDIPEPEVFDGAFEDLFR
jgi:hypothetical protein